MLSTAIDNMLITRTTETSVNEDVVSEKLPVNNTTADDVTISEYDLVDIPDDKLFQEPPPHIECPICMLPMPFHSSICDVKTAYMACCGKTLCFGCVYATHIEIENGTIKDCCAFCREPTPLTNAEHLESVKKRARLHDPGAIYMLAEFYAEGESGLLKDEEKACELWEQAAGLGSCMAQADIGSSYYRGEGVEKNIEKAICYWKLAAIGGNEKARHNLGTVEVNNGNTDQAMKHWMISAKRGVGESLKWVGKGYKAGYITKDDYANALRTYQQTWDEMKSEQRSEARKSFENKELW